MPLPLRHGVRLAVKDMNNLPLSWFAIKDLATKHKVEIMRMGSYQADTQEDCFRAAVSESNGVCFGGHDKIRCLHG